MREKRWKIAAAPLGIGLGVAPGTNAGEAGLRRVEQTLARFGARVDHSPHAPLSGAAYTPGRMLVWRANCGVSRRLSWLLAVAALALAAPAPAQEENDDCFLCHGEADLTTERGRRTVSLFVSAAAFGRSVHGEFPCTACHADLDGVELPHDAPLQPADCSLCHDEIQQQHDESLHGQAVARGDRLAPRCADCHGKHDIRKASDPRSPVSPLKVPFTCGRCHREGGPVQLTREISQENILEHYSESIHGEGLLKKGLIVAPHCASCHTAHSILPHTDPRSSIARSKIAATCTTCHAQIEQVHRKVIKGELWEKEAHVLPACVECHPPHEIRNVFYDQGVADAECLRCHADTQLTAATDGRSLFVDVAERDASRHATVTCTQCHSGAAPSRDRSCASITSAVDCSSCHAAVAEQFTGSTHGQLEAAGDENGPTCKECHGSHGVRGRLDSASPIFATNIPTLCASCHREGEVAALRRVAARPGGQVAQYTESIHGKGLIDSGLTVTATCTSCHPAHGVLPANDPASSVYHENVPTTCGKCHHGIAETFGRSIHATMVGKTEERLPVCHDCHTAHTIRRADQDGFKLEIMTTCGDCHAEIASTYFETFHGKVSELGYTKTAKCYDCHGAHDVLPVADPDSHLSRGNVVDTCRKCHPGATRQFAGYLTHATHHDPDKYPYLYWTFWGMTSLLAFTFFLGGAHTLLWIPRAVQMRRELREAEALEESVRETTPKQGDGASDERQSESGEEE